MPPFGLKGVEVVEVVGRICYLANFFKVTSSFLTVSYATDVWFFDENLNCFNWLVEVDVSNVMD